jgi:hypothetical protein
MLHLPYTIYRLRIVGGPLFAGSRHMVLTKHSRDQRSSNTWLSVVRSSEIQADHGLFRHLRIIHQVGILPRFCAFYQDMEELLCVNSFRGNELIPCKFLVWDKVWIIKLRHRRCILDGKKLTEIVSKPKYRKGTNKLNGIHEEVTKIKFGKWMLPFNYESSVFLSAVIKCKRLRVNVAN